MEPARKCLTSRQGAGKRQYGASKRYVVHGCADADFRLLRNVGPLIVWERLASMIGIVILVLIIGLCQGLD